MEGQQPGTIAKSIGYTGSIQKEFNAAQANGKKVSLADLIVLAGCAAVEKAAQDAGHGINVPFTPVVWMHRRNKPMLNPLAYLEPVADGFRNYRRAELPGIYRRVADR